MGHTKVKSRGQKKSTTYLPFNRCGPDRIKISIQRDLMKLTSELFQRDFLESVLPPGLGGECGGSLTDDGLLSSLNHLEGLSFLIEDN